MHHLLIADIVAAVAVVVALAIGLIEATPGAVEDAPLSAARITFINFVPPSP